MKTASYPSAACRRMRNATSGPSSAPAVSMARCTPKARPRVSGAEDSEISASRGAVRSPLPVRSTARTAPIRGRLWTRSSAGLHTADSPYPTAATALYRPPPRSARWPPTNRTSALKPL